MLWAAGSVQPLFNVVMLQCRSAQPRATIGSSEVLSGRVVDKFEEQTHSGAPCPRPGASPPMPVKIPYQCVDIIPGIGVALDMTGICNPPAAPVLRY